MMKRKSWFLVHRWLGLVVSLQLLAWSVGGFVFSILDIEDVRGNSDRVLVEHPPLRVDRVTIAPAEATDVVHGHGIDSEITRILLRERLGATVYEFYSGEEVLCAVDARTAAYLPHISRDEAGEIALADFRPEATILSIRLIEDDAPNEYRGGLLPAYQVMLDHPDEPHLYVSALTGEVTKRRNNLWRTFDFFWMLHIMDYRDRDNFNHWLLSLMSLLAILTSASGLVLWWWRIPRRRAGSRSSAVVEHS